jgi:hypothetical protein
MDHIELYKANKSDIDILINIEQSVAGTSTYSGKVNEIANSGVIR